MAGTNGFTWFTGLATFAAPCPAALREPRGLRRFFVAPNDAAFGARVPRTVVHESLHAFQLAGSSWLQRMVAEEWERVLTLEHTGTAPPLGPLRTTFGRPAPGMPYSVRDLVECLARFWDLHVRGPDRIIEEEALPDPGGRLAALRAARRAAGGPPRYTMIEYEAAMRGGGSGESLDSYARPYLWLEWAAFNAPAVTTLGAHDPAHNHTRASWAAQVLVPIAGFVALNTDDPVRALVVCADEILGDPEGLRVPTLAGDLASIELDVLACWTPFVERMARALRAAGLPPSASPRGLINRQGWCEHPVWRYHARRCDAIARGLTAMLTYDASGAPIMAPPQEPPGDALLRDVLRQHAFAAYALMGLPALRTQLGVAFAPPVMRFPDASLTATEAVAGFAPWPVDAATLTAAVDDAVRRHEPLWSADSASRLGLPASAFRPA